MPERSDLPVNYKLAPLTHSDSNHDAQAASSLRDSTTNLQQDSARLPPLQRQAIGERNEKHRHDPLGGRAGPTLLIVASVNWEGLSRTPYLFSQAGWNVDVLASPAFSLAHSSFIRTLHGATGSPRELVE